MIHIAICDDEEISRSQMASLLRKQTQKFTVSLFSSGEQLFLSGEQFDILFLDIQMQGMSGLDTAKKLRSTQPRPDIDLPLIIFLTAYRDFMDQAFDVYAFHYLMKPLDENKFSEVFSNALQSLEGRKKAVNQAIRVKTTTREYKVIYIKNIKYVESSNKQVIFFTTEGVVSSYGQIARYEQDLGDGFFRCHRSFLVNLDMVAGFSQDTVELLSGERVLMARKNYKALSDAVMNHGR